MGALEAAWYRATGKQLLFSEQHMIDCAWEAGNSGCYGARRRAAPPCPALRDAQALSTATAIPAAAAARSC